MVSNNLRKIRLERHLAQKDIADAIGICTRTINRIEKGESTSLEIALLISSYLDLRVEDIFFKHH